MNTTQSRGIVFFHKPPDMTSFQSLGALKRIYRTKKIGHTGTLDKFAEGVMIACVGPYTRLAKHIVAAEKRYIATVKIGIQTDTLDPEGEVVATGNLPPLKELEDAVSRFIGEIDQVPPVYSAVHVEGKRAHTRARRGESVSMPSRRVFIHSIDILSYEKDEFKIAVHCSKGTYIRSLARDLAKQAGTCGCLASLTRVAVGAVNLESCCTMEEILSEPEKCLRNGEELISQGILPFRTTVLKKDEESNFYNGKQISPKWFISDTDKETDSKWIAVLDDGGSIAGVIKQTGSGYFYDCVFPPAG